MNSLPFLSLILRRASVYTRIQTSQALASGFAGEIVSLAMIVRRIENTTVGQRVYQPRYQAVPPLNESCLTFAGDFFSLLPDGPSYRRGSLT